MRSTAGRVRRAAAGFTLIELMVVVLLVGLVATFAVINLGGDSARERQQREAQRLHARMDLAREEAVLRARSLGIRFSERGYRFLALYRDQWRPLEAAGVLAPRELPESLSIAVDIDGLEVALGGEDEPEAPGDDGTADGDSADDAPRPQIFFLPGGEVVPAFSVTVLSELTATEYRITPGDAQWLTLTEHRF